MNEMLKRIADMSLLDIYQARATQAWDTFDRLLTDDELERAEASAIEYQQEYFRLYYKLNSDQCTCKPDDAIACDVCQAQIKAKSIYREEM